MPKTACESHPSERTVLMTDYSLLCAQLHALIDDVPSWIANLSNASALLFWQLDRLNWAGFYWRRGEELVLAPFQGKPACVRIPMEKGVCGTAAARDETIRVDDVHAFPGHIACDSASLSELVIPLHREGRVVGVLDLDSPVPGRFSPEDQAGLEAFARVLEEKLARTEPPFLL